MVITAGDLEVIEECVRRFGGGTSEAHDALLRAAFREVYVRGCLAQSRDQLNFLRQEISQSRAKV